MMQTLRELGTSLLLLLFLQPILMSQSTPEDQQHGKNWLTSETARGLWSWMDTRRGGLEPGRRGQCLYPKGSGRRDALHRENPDSRALRQGQYLLWGGVLGQPGRGDLGNGAAGTITSTTTTVLQLFWTPFTTPKRLLVSNQSQRDSVRRPDHRRGKRCQQQLGRKVDSGSHHDRGGLVRRDPDSLKSIRFSSTSSDDASFGVDFERVIRRKNEFSLLE